MIQHHCGSIMSCGAQMIKCRIIRLLLRLHSLGGELRVCFAQGTVKHEVALSIATCTHLCVRGPFCMFHIANSDTQPQHADRAPSLQTRSCDSPALNSLAQATHSATLPPQWPLSSHVTLAQDPSEPTTPSASCTCRQCNLQAAAPCRLLHQGACCPAIPTSHMHTQPSTTAALLQAACGHISWCNLTTCTAHINQQHQCAPQPHPLPPPHHSCLLYALWPLSLCSAMGILALTPSSLPRSISATAMPVSRGSFSLATTVPQGSMISECP